MRLLRLWRDTGRRPNTANMAMTAGGDCVAPKVSRTAQPAGGGRNSIVVQATSAGANGGNFARISINDEAVVVERNCNGHYRGLHIVLINPSTGKVEMAKVFDTYKSSDELDTWIDKGTIPADYIVVAACRDDCVTRLSEMAKTWFTNMGSKQITNLQPHQGFAFIGSIGKGQANEERAEAEADQVQVT